MQLVLDQNQTIDFVQQLKLLLVLDFLQMWPMIPNQLQQQLAILIIPSQWELAFLLVKDQILENQLLLPGLLTLIFQQHSCPFFLVEPLVSQGLSLHLQLSFSLHLNHFQIQTLLSSNFSLTSFPPSFSSSFFHRQNHHFHFLLHFMQTSSVCISS